MRLVPDGFLTIREAAERLAVGLYSGEPDPPIVEQHKKSGFDVADGAAIDEAIATLWKAVDKGDLQAFVVGPTNPNPLKLTAQMSQGIPALRSARGSDLNFLRSTNPHHASFVKWFGPGLTQVSVVFRAEDISKLPRKFLRKRRRRTASAGARNAGRPSLQAEVKGMIRNIVEERRWSSTQSLKALTRAVNDQGKWQHPVSDETVTRALDALHADSGDRRFERVRRIR